LTVQGDMGSGIPDLHKRGGIKSSHHKSTAPGQFVPITEQAVLVHHRLHLNF